MVITLLKCCLATLIYHSVRLSMSHVPYFCSQSHLSWLLNILHKLFTLLSCHCCEIVSIYVCHAAVSLHFQ